MSRIALVTGAGRGIGRACALALAGTGVRVAVTARSQDELSSVAEAIREGGGQAMTVAADLSQSEAPAAILKEVRSAWAEDVSILVNNAGIGSSQDPKPLVEFDDAFWDLTMVVNLRAPYLLTKLALPPMLQKGWGRIINIASINSKTAPLHGAAYAASKHALAGLTKATAKEIAGSGVTANAVCPGVTATLLNDKRLQYDAERLGVEFAELEKSASPLGRRIRPDEVAAAVVFMAADSSSAVNGQLLNVCGGTIMD